MLPRPQFLHRPCAGWYRVLANGYHHVATGRRVATCLRPWTTAIWQHQNPTQNWWKTSRPLQGSILKCFGRLESTQSMERTDSMGGHQDGDKRRLQRNRYFRMEGMPISVIADQGRREAKQRKLRLLPKDNLFKVEEIYAMSSDIKHVQILQSEYKNRRIAFLEFTSKELADKNLVQLSQRDDVEEVAASLDKETVLRVEAARKLKVTMPEAQGASIEDVFKLSHDIREVRDFDGTFFVMFDSETDAIRNYKMLKQKPEIKVLFAGYKSRYAKLLQLRLSSISELTEEQLMAMSMDILKVRILGESTNRAAILQFGSDEIARKNLRLFKNNYPNLNPKLNRDLDDKTMLQFYLKRSEKEPETNEDILKLSDKIICPFAEEDKSNPECWFLGSTSEFDAAAFYRQNKERFGNRLKATYGTGAHLIVFNILSDVEITKEEAFKASDYIIDMRLLPQKEGRRFRAVALQFLTVKHAKEAHDKWKSKGVDVKIADKNTWYSRW